MEIDHCVRFLGILDFPDEVFLWLDTVDIFLHPSETEGLPRALVEANSRGCAAIGSNVGGIPELLSEDMIIEPKDHVNLRNIIINMSSNSKLRMESISSFKRAANYEYSKLNKKRFAFYKKVKEGILHD
jgi:glycosyltransferase involved in cell wall biosynthesis